MPAHHRLGRDNRQMLAPPGAEAAGQHPQQLVPEAQASTWPGASGAGQHSELMVQQQVLEHELLAWANAGQDGRQEQPDEFKHVLSIADLRRARFCRRTPHSCGFQAPMVDLGAIEAQAWSATSRTERRS